MRQRYRRGVIGNDTPLFLRATKHLEIIPNSPGYGMQIIYLNGASSSGKTTLAKAVQEKSDRHFLHIGIDKVIGMMPAKLNDWAGGTAPLGFSWIPGIDKTGHPVYEIHAGPFAEKMVHTLREIVLTMAQMGHYIVVDDVSLRKTEVDAWKDVLKEFKVLWVAVTAPLDVLEARERNRGDRILGSARAQYFHVHKNVSYDLECDTSKDSTEISAERILEAIQR